MDKERLNVLIGANLKLARKSRGMSQADVVKAIGIQRTSLTKIERGQQNLSCHMLIQISRVLGVSPESILF